MAIRSKTRRVRYSPKVDISVDEKLSPLLPPEPLRSYMAPASFGVDAEIECGAQLMRAPEVWDDLGNTGAGAVIAVIDSGVCWYHPDIESQMWVNPGEDLDGDGVLFDADDENGIDDDGNGYVDDFVGYDIDNGDNDPNDDNSHGSHCAGTVAGDGTGGFQSGMAPDAEIMAIRVGLSFSDEPDVWEGMQYAADNGADAITMSLGWPHSNNPDRATWRQNCENTIDLGTAMVIAAGNEGSGNEPDNVRTPGDVPRIISVGAVNCSDSAAGFSSRGPVTWQDVAPYNDHPYPPGLIKPDVSAPGVDTRSHNKCSGYSYKSGTSMATPHVAGAVALMIAANPGLEHDDIKQLLEDTSVDLGPPGKDNTYGTGRVDAYEAVLLSGTSDGRVSLKESAAGCASTLHVTVSDADLKGTGSLTIEIHSGSEPTPEALTMPENGSSGVFKGTIETDAGTPAADGKIQVADGDTVVATYIDADDGEGGINVPKTDETAIDCRAPAITDVRSEDIDDSSAWIRWSTDEVSDSEVDYGPVLPPAEEEIDASRVSAHAIQLSGLEECTVYYYSVASGDALGNRARDDNEGAYHSFETYGVFPEIGLSPCHRGHVTLDREIYACGGDLTVSVNDLDLNTDTGLVETVVVTVSSTTEPAGELVTLTEDSANSARFTGTIPLGSGAGSQGDGRLDVGDGELVTATYRDEDDGTGAGRTTTATSDTDCAATPLEGVEVTRLSQSWAEIRWTTAEPMSSRVRYGTNPSALDQLVEDGALVTEHMQLVTGFSACEAIHFVVEGEDAYGNAATLDAGGAPFQLETRQIPGLYYYDGFESVGDWILRGEFEIGAPQGLGGGSGNPDPSEAFVGTGVLGSDLSGQGSRRGDYENDALENATSGLIECGSCQNSTLILRRQLNVDAGDTAKIAVISAGKDTIWDNGGARITESGWQEQRVDMSAVVDGKPYFQLKFSMIADGSGGYSGWNVDELIIKDGSLPDYAACGECGVPPSMAGLASVNDADACAAGGLTLAWPAAAAWGSGQDGSYAVYRSTSADFEPSAATLVASGLAGTSWVDADAPVDTPLWYVVRAENDESCGAGPANAGAMDTNLVRVEGLETVTRPAAGSPGTGLRVVNVGKAHVRLEWAPSIDTAFTRVYRADNPQMSGASAIGETPELIYEDEGAAATPGIYFYRIVSVNPCGQETP